MVPGVRIRHFLTENQKNLYIYFWMIETSVGSWRNEAWVSKQGMLIDAFARQDVNMEGRREYNARGMDVEYSRWFVVRAIV